MAVICTPTAADVAELAELQRRHETAVRGSSSASPERVAALVTGSGAATHRHRLVRGDDGRTLGWAWVQDRAGGRVVCAVTIAPELSDDKADPLAAELFDWAAGQAADIARARGLSETQLDSGAFADDPRQQRWLAKAGLRRVRRWWQMSRPVQPEEGEPDALPAPRPGVSIRRVDREADGSVAEEDVRRVHDVLEQAFVDHFNSHTETFAEFYLRLRTDPGHRWDHWWLAELVDDGPAEPAGALVATVTGTDGATEGSYVEYLGVLPNARGRGVATSLLYALIADAAQRGRDMVGLEVDADSPTGADRLYTALGFSTAYVTESWHCQLVLPQR